MEIGATRKCSNKQTYSQYEYKLLMELGGIRLKAEHSIREVSNVYLHRGDRHGVD